MTPRQVDLLLQNTQIADLFRLRLFPGWVGVRDGQFVYVEEGDPPADLQYGEAKDLDGRIVAPGLIDSHMHIESSLVTPRRFAEAVLPYGTTAVLADPHEIGNAAGEEGVRWMIRASKNLPLRVYFAIPSCVPATSPALEWTSTVFDADMVSRLAQKPSVIALGEVMDYRGVLAGQERLRDMVTRAEKLDLLIEGHIPSLRGMELSEYLTWGMGSDHTLADPDKILEQTSKGLAVMLQEKSLTPENLETVASLPDRSRILIVTDDIEPNRLHEGHLSAMVRLAIERGMPPLEALAAASQRPARYLRLRRLGAIAPGCWADFLILESLEAFPPLEVFVAGQRVAVQGELTDESFPAPPPAPAGQPIPGPFTPEDFKLAPEVQGSRTVTANAVVVLNDINTLTDLERMSLTAEKGYAVFQEGDDLALGAVVSRNGAYHSVGIIKGLGMRRGAYASSFAHDSHNFVVIGRDPQSMSTASDVVRRLRGGVAVVDDEQTVAQFPMRIASLLTDARVEEAAQNLAAVEEALRDLGMHHRRPFLLLTIMSLTVSPRYKLSDRGVIDVEGRRVLPPWE